MDDARDADYHLLWVGKQLAFIRIAADYLEALGEDAAIEAAYHASAGVSDAKDVADSRASWLNQELQLGYVDGNAVRLTDECFLHKVVTKLPHVKDHLGRLQSAFRVKAEATRDQAVIKGVVGFPEAGSYNYHWTNIGMTAMKPLYWVLSKAL